MSYLKKIEYEVIPKDSFLVIRNCPKCGKKTHFKNTKKFRVNANGNKLDVWLIYQCEECKHTLNLTIYERQNVSSIKKKEYERFLNNDEWFAEMYGKDMQLFRKNKADIDLGALDYDFVKFKETTESSASGEVIALTIHNPYQLKIRPEKHIAEILGLSRNQIKSMMAQGEIKLDRSLPQYIFVSIDRRNG